MLSPTAIRETLKGWVTTHLSTDAGDVLIEELGFVNRQDGRSVDMTFRADLAVANGRLVAFEIKSGADSLKRWPSQCTAYFNVFDEVWLCTHGRHLEKALGVTPKGVGILVTDDLGGLVLLRNARRNGKCNAYDLSGLLWREELEVLCERHGIEVKKRETKSDIRHKVSSTVPIEAIRDYVLSRLKVRKGG
ncbi:sce7726 family protein [Pseudomonas sp. 148P]|uniref:Sce7726 family protein n=1 Tax=Pseudomonas ulcerans TaxID=3115852 RepID=A0ABU7HX12_9PSED|nr:MULTISPECIES: sce7726 family protein [unclassified Pseudomonas]MEE1924349.1 sce7726 family protein [Pseudomonas sp. 147P]MEE1936100.1 sce7726 family protein [Pseudomonas sp. 148P]